MGDGRRGVGGGEVREGGVGRGEFNCHLIFHFKLKFS